MIIVLEGIDGCGKTTTGDALKIKLEIDNKKVLYLDAFGKYRDFIVEYVLNNNISKHTELMFLIGCVNETYYSIINKQHLYDYIIIDRLFLSTFIYQSIINDVNPEIIDYIYNKLDITKDKFKTFILDIEPEIALERIKKRIKQDKYDNLQIKQYELMREKYLNFVDNKYIFKLDNNTIEDNINQILYEIKRG